MREQGHPQVCGGSPERLKEFAAELVREPVDVIVMIGTPAGFAATRATDTIPIVLGAISDPIGVGLVKVLLGLAGMPLAIR